MDEDNKTTPTQDPQAEAPAEQPAGLRLSKEDSLLQSAGEGMAEVPDQAQTPVVPEAPKKKGHKKLLMVVLLLVAVGIAGAVFALSGKKTEEPTQTANDLPAKIDAPTQSFNADKVSYAYRAKDSDPYSIYYRPAAGGERKEVTKLDREQTVAFSDTLGQLVSFVGGNKIMLSKDGGLTFSQIYESDTEEDIISLEISGDSTRIAFSTVSNTNSAGSSIYTIDLSGKDKKEIDGTKSTAYQVIGYDESKQKIAYSTGCWNCDGTRTGWKLLDLKTKKSTDIVKFTPETDYNDYAISADFTKFVRVLGTAYSGADSNVGQTTIAPYTVNLVDIASGKSSIIATIGKKGEKNANGTTKFRRIDVGFETGKNTPYYADGKELRKYEGGKSSIIYSAEETIYQVIYLGSKSALVSTVESIDTGDFNLVSYDIKADKSTQIFVGDNNTVIFGVTTK